MRQVLCLILEEESWDLQIEWLNDYHEQCVQKVGPVLEAQGKLDVLKWLQDQCKPLD